MVQNQPENDRILILRFQPAQDSGALALKVPLSVLPTLLRELAHDVETCEFEHVMVTISARGMVVYGDDDPFDPTDIPLMPDEVKDGASLNETPERDHPSVQQPAENPPLPEQPAGAGETPG